MIQSKKQLKRIKRDSEMWMRKVQMIPKVIKCDNCNRFGISDPECFSIEYCRKHNVRFLYGSCRCPQYDNSLRNPTRGDVDKIYGNKK